MITENALKRKYEMLAAHFDERAMRLCLGADAACIGHGGVSAVARAAGVSRTTVHAGVKLLREKESSNVDEAKTRIRKPGGGRKAKKDKDAKLLSDLEKLLDPVTRGDPKSPLRWTSKSTTKLAEELQKQGH